MKTGAVIISRVSFQIEPFQNASPTDHACAVLQLRILRTKEEDAKGK
jgi:hypothetical protein